MEPEGAHLFRTVYVWWIIASLWLVMFIMFVGLAITPTPLPVRIVSVAAAVIIAVVVLRARRAGIETSSADVIVRTYSGKEIRVPWADVSSFALVDASPFNRSVYVAAKLNDGTVLKTQGLVAPSRRSKSAERLLGELESQRPR